MRTSLKIAYMKGPFSGFGSRDPREVAALDALYRTLKGQPVVAPAKAPEKVAAEPARGLSPELVRLARAAKTKADLVAAQTAPDPTQSAPAVPAAPVESETTDPIEKNRGHWLTAAAGLIGCASVICCGCAGIGTWGSMVSLNNEPKPVQVIPYKTRPHQSPKSVASAPSNGVAPEAQRDGSLDEATDADFNEVLADSTYVFVDFYATWCPPCQYEEPLLTQVAGKYEGKVKVVRVDAEKNPTTADAYGISAYPTLIEYKDGKEIWRVEGALSKEQLEAEFDALLKK